MGGSTGAGWKLQSSGALQSLEERTKKYVACPSCKKERALAHEFVDGMTCYNPKCKTYTPPMPLSDVGVWFAQACFNNAVPGWHKRYLGKILKLTKELDKKYALTG
jgi:hypothetical protein